MCKIKKYVKIIIVARNTFSFDGSTFRNTSINDAISWESQPCYYRSRKARKKVLQDAVFSRKRWTIISGGEGILLSVDFFCFPGVWFSVVLSLRQIYPCDFRISVGFSITDASVFRTRAGRRGWGEGRCDGYAKIRRPSARSRRAARRRVIAVYRQTRRVPAKFPVQLLNRIHARSSFFSSDEAHFHLGGSVNRRNFRR